MVRSRSVVEDLPNTNRPIAVMLEELRDGDEIARYVAPVRVLYGVDVRRVRATTGQQGHPTRGADRLLNVGVLQQERARRQGIHRRSSNPGEDGVGASDVVVGAHLGAQVVNDDHQNIGSGCSSATPARVSQYFRCLRRNHLHEPGRNEAACEEGSRQRPH